VPSLEGWLFLAALTLALFPVWGVYYPPGLDVPEHALAMQIVAQGSHDAGAECHGRLFLNSPWAPYSLLFVLASPLVRLAGALAAVKVFLTIIVVGTAVALRRLLRLAGSDPFAFYFGFPFLFGTAWLAGFLYYLAALPLALLLVHAALRRPCPDWKGFFARLAAMFVLAWMHPLLYVGAAVLLGAMLAWLLARQKRAATEWMAVALWLGLPAAYVIAWTPALALSTAVHWRSKLHTLTRCFLDVGAPNLAVFDQPFWLPKLPLLAWLGWTLAEWGKGWRLEAGGWRAHGLQPASAMVAEARGALKAAVLTLLAATLLLPEGFSGQLVTAAFRYAPLAGLLTAALLPPLATRRSLQRALLVAWCFAVLAGNAALAWRFNQQMNQFVRLARLMAPRQTVALAYEGPENTLFHHALSYYNLEEGGVNASSFLVKEGTQHFPVRLLPPWPWGNAWDNTLQPPLTHPGARAFRYVVAKTSRGSEEPEPALPFHRLMAREGGWLLFERR
jgi:hypothetical protein